MTVQIPRSEIKKMDFVAEVRSYIAKIEEHRNSEGQPAPVANPWVMQAVKRVPQKEGPDNLVVDYEVVDDTPPLEDRKANLRNKIAQKEQRKINEIDPPGKSRLRNMQVLRIMAQPEDKWTVEHVNFVAEHQRISEQVEQIRYDAAVKMAEVDDLTEETIGSFE